MLSTFRKPQTGPPWIGTFLYTYLRLTLLYLILRVLWQNTLSSSAFEQTEDLLFLLLTGTALYAISRQFHRQVLRESRQQQVIPRNTTEAIITVNDTGQILEFNPQAEDLFGFTRSEVIGRSLDQHPSLRQSLLVDDIPLGSSNQLTTVTHRNGQAIPVELTFAILAQDEAVTITSFFNRVVMKPSSPAEDQSLLEGVSPSDIELTLAYEAVLEGWARALDLRDRETQGHTQRVTEMTLRLAIALGMDDEALVHIRRGALLHDIGKIGISDSILLKPEPLNSEERKIIELHAEYAYDLLSPLEFLQPALDIPYYHHEKWDGTGYPQGLKGEEIPYAARIFAVVDVWDALRSDRPYREGWPDDQVCDYLRSQSGKHFDPHILQVFLDELTDCP